MCLIPEKALSELVGFALTTSESLLWSCCSSLTKHNICPHPHPRRNYHKHSVIQGASPKTKQVRRITHSHTHRNLSDTQTAAASQRQRSGDNEESLPQVIQSWEICLVSSRQWGRESSPPAAMLPGRIWRPGEASAKASSCNSEHSRGICERLNGSRIRVVFTNACQSGASTDASRQDRSQPRRRPGSEES